MVVQRKWMYLESIFIGGDIRSQLPEEAKKFDAIDKTFKKVHSLALLYEIFALFKPKHCVLMAFISKSFSRCFLCLFWVFAFIKQKLFNNFKWLSRTRRPVI